MPNTEDPCGRCRHCGYDPLQKDNPEASAYCSLLSGETFDDAQRNKACTYYEPAHAFPRNFPDSFVNRAVNVLRMEKARLERANTVLGKSTLLCPDCDSVRERANIQISNTQNLITSLVHGTSIREEEYKGIVCLLYSGICR